MTRAASEQTLLSRLIRVCGKEPPPHISNEVIRRWSVRTSTGRLVASLWVWLWSGVARFLTSLYAAKSESVLRFGLRRGSSILATRCDPGPRCTAPAGESRGFGRGFRNRGNFPTMARRSGPFLPGNSLFQTWFCQARCGDSPGLCRPRTRTDYIRSHLWGYPPGSPAGNQFPEGACRMVQAMRRWSRECGEDDRGAGRGLCSKQGVIGSGSADPARSGPWARSRAV